MNILADLETAYKLFNTIAVTHKSTLDALRKCEDEENDIRHAYELGNLKYKERAKLATRQGIVLKNRRKVKDDLEVMEPLVYLLQSVEGIAFMKKMQPAIGESRKADRMHQNRIYISRTKTVTTTLNGETA